MQDEPHDSPGQIVFEVRWQDGMPRLVEATDAYAAALAFQRTHQPRNDAEIVVVSPDGTESVFGYRQTVPTEHLDD